MSELPDDMQFGPVDFTGLEPDKLPKNHYHGTCADCDTKDKKIAELEGENEKQSDVLNRIKQWCRAYPRTVFIEPTKEKWARANEVLEADEGCPSLSAISGSNMRHVVEGIQKIIDETALEGDKRAEDG